MRYFPNMIVVVAKTFGVSYQFRPNTPMILVEVNAETVRRMELFNKSNFREPSGHEGKIVNVGPFVGFMAYPKRISYSVDKASCVGGVEPVVPVSLFVFIATPDEGFVGKYHSFHA